MVKAKVIHCLKCTQKNCTMSFKLQTVRKIDRASKYFYLSSQESVWHPIPFNNGTMLRKFGNIDQNNQTPSNTPNSPKQKIMEFETQMKLLERQRALLEREAYAPDKQAIILI